MERYSLTYVLESDSRSKKGKKSAGKELKSLLGASPDSSFLEENINEEGIADRVVDRRRKSVIKRMVEAQERKTGMPKKSKGDLIIIESDSDDSRCRKSGGIDLSFLEEDEIEENALVSPEVVMERNLARKKRREWAEANPKTIERVVQLGNSSGLLSVDEDNEYLREVIKGVIDDAVRYGLELDKVDIGDEEKMRRMEEEDGKFDWQEEEESDHDWDMASGDDDSQAF